MPGVHAFVDLGRRGTGLPSGPLVSSKCPRERPRTKVRGSDSHEQIENLHRRRVGDGRVFQRHRAAAGTTATAAGTEHDVLRHRQRPRQGRRSRRHRGGRPILPDAGGASWRGGKTWRAYLSTQPADGKPAINARDRIGNGPWQNFKGTVVAANVNDLHSDNNKLGVENSLSERGLIIPYRGFAPNRHDVLTGSDMQGRAFPAGEDRTCKNWTSSTQGAAMVGHIDKMGLRDDAPSKSWTSSHPSRGPDGGCSQADLRSTGGDGLFYCFASN